MLCEGAALAQGAVKSVHGDWQIRCDTPPGANSEQCALFQSVMAEDRANVGLTVLVLKTADQKSRLMRVVRCRWACFCPRASGSRSIRPTSAAPACALSPPRLLRRGGDGRCPVAKMKTGQTATFFIFQTPEEGIGFPMGLKGFGEGYDKLP